MSSAFDTICRKAGYTKQEANGMKFLLEHDSICLLFSIIHDEADVFSIDELRTLNSLPKSMLTMSEKQLDHAISSVQDKIRALGAEKDDQLTSQLSNSATERIYTSCPPLNKSPGQISLDSDTLLNYHTSLKSSLEKYGCCMQLPTIDIDARISEDQKSLAAAVTECTSACSQLLELLPGISALRSSESPANTNEAFSQQAAISSTNEGYLESELRLANLIRDSVEARRRAVGVAFAKVNPALDEIMDVSNFVLGQSTERVHLSAELACIKARIAYLANVAPVLHADAQKKSPPNMFDDDSFDCLIAENAMLAQEYEALLAKCMDAVPVAASPVSCMALAEEVYNWKSTIAQREIQHLQSHEAVLQRIIDRIFTMHAMHEDKANNLKSLDASIISAYESIPAKIKEFMFQSDTCINILKKAKNSARITPLETLGIKSVISNLSGHRIRSVTEARDALGYLVVSANKAPVTDDTAQALETVLDLHRKLISSAVSVPPSTPECSHLQDSVGQLQRMIPDRARRQFIPLKE